MKKSDKIKITVSEDAALEAFMRTPPPKPKVEIVPLAVIPPAVIKKAEVITPKKPKKKK